MATQITATLPTLNFPREVDYPTQEDWAAFSAAAELNFGILGNDWSTQMQLWKTEANAMSIESNNNADIAQAVANYQGDWTSKGYTLGQTVSVSGVYYICKLTHLTGQNPTDVSSLYWNLAIGNWNLKADKTELNLKIDKDISGYASKTTPADEDLIPLSDSDSSFEIKKLSWSNLKATLETYFDTLYLAISGYPAFSATKSGQSFTANVFTKLACNTEEYDTTNAYDNATNFRFTPQKAGKYRITIQMQSAAGNYGAAISVYKNGSSFKRLQSLIANTFTDTLSGSITIVMNGTTDYIEAYGMWTSNNTANSVFQAEYIVGS